MKTFVVFQLCMTVSCIGFTQTARKQEIKTFPSNREAYGKIYELKDYSFQNGDSTILDDLSIESMMYLVQPTESVEVPNEDLGITIVLYSKERINKKPYEAVEGSHSK